VPLALQHPGIKLYWNQLSGV